MIYKQEVEDKVGYPTAAALVDDDGGVLMWRMVHTSRMLHMPWKMLTRLGRGGERQGKGEGEGDRVERREKGKGELSEETGRRRD